MKTRPTGRQLNPSDSLETKLKNVYYWIGRYFSEMMGAGVVAIVLTLLTVWLSSHHVNGAVVGIESIFASAFYIFAIVRFSQVKRLAFYSEELKEAKAEWERIRRHENPQS